MPEGTTGRDAGAPGEIIVLESPPVGVKIVTGAADGFERVERYRGISYCDAVRAAGEGGGLFLEPGCIEVCKWAPAVLGFKEPDSSFERGLEPRLGGGVSGIYMARLDCFSDGHEPDVVIVRGRPAQVMALAQAMGEGALQRRYRGQVYRTALGVGDSGVSWRALLVNVTNRALARLVRWKWFESLTHRMFRSESVTTAFEKLLKMTMSSMSICRNSTVIPLQEGAGNVSFFCTGGVTWGGNPPANVTSGFPYHLFRKVAGMVEYR